MLSKDQNELLVRIGPGTPAGEMFRRYWLPVAVSTEATDVPMPIRILGEDLILFRDSAGRPGLVGLQCPHRLTSLEYGRVECGGIRCIYHGWLFDVEGRCLDMPGEPADSNFKNRVRHLAYPCRDLGGLVFAYLGPGAPPLLPNFEILTRKDCTRWADRDWMNHPCNYLQLVENDMDPVHAAVMHGHPSYAQNHLFPNMPRKMIFEETEYGVQSTRYADADRPGEIYLRKVNTFLPTVIGFGGGTSPDNESGPEFGGTLRWRVPIDDDNTAHFRIYMIPHRNGEPMSFAPPRDMGGTTVPPDIVQRSVNGVMWHAERGPDGRYVLNKTWQQDYVAMVSQGKVMDRTREYLGSSDRGVVLIRKSLQRAIAMVRDGGDPPGVVRDPSKDKLIMLPRTNTILRGSAARTIEAELA